MRYRLRPLLPGQFGLLSLFVLMTVAAIVFAILRLAVSLPGRVLLLALPGVFLLLLVLWAGFYYWETRNPNKVNRGRRAVMGALLMLLVLSNLLWGNYIVHRGAFRFSSMDVLAGISLLFMMTGHIIFKAIRNGVWFVLTRSNGRHLR